MPTAESSVKKDRYRPDIDGLRAVAVLAVLVFHAFPKWLPGGYVGVDVFFAISGFLIGGLLIDEASTTGRVHILKFYQRRALRILPALTCMLVACYVAARVLLPPAGVREIGTHGAGAALFLSNFVLWREAGYFDQAAQLKPLLHLWSLAVEEQFYVLAPLLLLGLVRLRVRIWLAVLALVFVSFALCATRPSASAAFYSPENRFWEIWCGVLLACAVRSDASSALAGHARRFAPVAPWIGCVMIAVACVTFSASQTFPVAANALPVVGGCLCIASPHAWPSRKLLSHPVAVFIGRVSYPLYLWHWPLLSFATLSLGHAPEPRLAMGLLLAAFVLATATYRFVETPLRFGNHPREKALALVVALAALGGFGVFLRSTRDTAASLAAADAQDVAWDKPDKACLRAAGLEGEIRAEDAIFCSMNGEADSIGALLLGDSSANSLYPGIAAAFADRGTKTANIGLGTCAPVRGAQGHFDWNRSCELVNEKAYAFAFAHPKIRVVILGFTPWDFRNMTFAGFQPHGERSIFDEELRRMRLDIAALRAAGKKVIAVFDAPHIGGAMGPCSTARSQMRRAGRAPPDACMFPVNQMPLRQPYLRWWQTAFESEPDVCVFNQIDALSEGASVRIADADGLLFRDDHHLSKRGSLLVGKQFAVAPGLAACR